MTNWYALQVFSGKEHWVANRLNTKGVETYCPTVPRDGRPEKLLPGYVLAVLDIPCDYRILNLTPHVHSVVGAGKVPLPIPDAEVQWLRQAAALRTAEPSGAVAGDRVRVRRGPLAGVEGVVTRERGSLRLVVEIQALGRGVSVEISRRDVEVIR